MMQSPLILASASRARQQMLRAAGVEFSVQAAKIDETALQRQWTSLSPKALPIELAKAKALSISQNHPAAIVIGADQTLEFEGRACHKAASLAEARANLKAMLGHTHHLHAAVVCARGGQILFEHRGTASLTMRRASSAFVDGYISAMGETILRGVGGYEYEGLGAQLFDRVEGDFHTILGLPLLPLLAFLRRAAIMPT